MYLQVRSAILAMADLIDSLQSALNADANVSSKLREHVQQTDTVMEAMKKTNSKNHVLHSALPAGVSCTTAKLPSQKGDQDLMVRFSQNKNFETSRADPADNFGRRLFTHTLQMAIGLRQQVKTSHYRPQ